MNELLLVVRTAAGDRDVSVGFDDQVTVGLLAARLSDRFGPETGATLGRLTRGSSVLPADAALARSDLRSGDVVRLAAQTGVRHRPRADVVGRIRICADGRPDEVVEVLRGETVLGRSARCDVPLDDDLASRRHAKLVASDVIEVIDLASTNGTTVNDTPIDAPRRLRNGDRIGIGDTTVVVTQAAVASTAADTTGNVIEFNRPPRIGARVDDTEFELPAPPDRPPKQRLPMVSAAVPALMGIVLYLVTQSLLSVVFIGLSPLMLLGSWWESRRSGRADHAERLAAHREEVARLRDELDAALDAEVADRFTAAPAVGELDTMARELSPRLWERQPGDEDHLSLRVGIAPLPATTTVTVADGGDREQRAELVEIAQDASVLPPVPVTLSLPELGHLGVAGPEVHVANVARALVAQACTLHPPSELVVCALLSDTAVDDWAWLKWLPHTRWPLSPLGVQHLAHTVDGNLDVLEACNTVLAARRDAEAPVIEPRILVVVDDAMPLERARLSGLLESGAEHGMHLLWLSNTTRRLPKACGGVVDLHPSGSRATVGYVPRREHVDQVVVDPLDLAGAAALARDLAPIVDVSSGRTRDAGIPRYVPMVELLGGTGVLDAPREVLDRWRESATSRESTGLRVPIGVGGTGPFSVDLRHDGPHGLVAGTTGAGKSELLQSLLIGLAVTYPPERITFLLVDYKGGSAFKDCVQLPHTVGLVTDLTPALVKRALTSLRAELHRRERLLNLHGAKDLLTLEAAGHPDTPPSLVIVVDEFAALAREVPAFVDGVVDIAQRGRSLGLHLLLATQRPQGVITDTIRANTNLKIALRVATDDESTDVLGDAAAGQIDRSLRGRAVARLGPSDLISFQTGYAGGHTLTEDGDPQLALAWFDTDGLRPWDQTERAVAAAGALTDLERLTATVTAAHRQTGASPPRRPWLDPLHERYDLLRLPRSGSDAELPIGVADEPDRQWQRIAAFVPDRDGSLLIYGAGGSGKTAALRTLAASAALTDAAHPVHVYGLDAAGRGLELLRPLPQVGAIVSADDYERLTRLLEDLTELVDQRSTLLASYDASTLTELRANAGEGLGPLPRVLLLIDGFENFQATYERVDRGRWHDTVLRLAADGRSVGLHLALTGTRRTSFPTMLTSTVGRRLVLRLATLDEYAMLGVDPSLVDGDEPAGRAVDADALVQLALVGDRTDTAGQALALRELGAALAADGTPPAPAVEVLGDVVPTDGLFVSTGGDRLTVGRDERLQPFAVPADGHLLIAGPSRSGRSTAIAVAAASAAAAGRPTVVLSARKPPVGLPASAQVHVGADAVRAALEALAEPDGQPAPLVLIDELEDLVDTPVDLVLERVLQRGDLAVVASCDVGVARRYSTTVNRLKRSRRVFVLQPDVDLDTDLLGSPVPRTLRPFPPGRGIYGDAGQLTVAQWAWPG